MKAKRATPSEARATSARVPELVRELGLELGSTLAAIDRYNSDYSAYGNEVYEEVETRVAHWSNFYLDAWFQHRLDRALAMAAHVDYSRDRMLHLLAR